MLRASKDQIENPRPARRWPVVANRHRRAAIDEATEIIELINRDFLELLQDEIGDDLEEAIMSLRSNPGKALRHLQLARRSLKSILRSSELVSKRAEAIVTVLNNAPADEEDEAA